MLPWNWDCICKVFLVLPEVVLHSCHVFWWQFWLQLHEIECFEIPPKFWIVPVMSSVKFSSVSQLCPTLCDPMDCSMPGLSVHHQLLQLAETHVHQVGDAIIDIIRISELKWIGMGEFNSDDHYIYYCGQESLRRNGVALIVNKRVWNAVLRCNLKNDRMISVHFQGKPFYISVIQIYAPTTDRQDTLRPRSVKPQ